MAQLTGDQRAIIMQSPVFIDRVGTVLVQKAQYFKELSTATRPEVNRRTQKRKRLARTILTTSWVQSYKQQVALFWLAYYQTGSPDLDENDIPTYDAIFADFDVTFDNFAGYLAGDESDTEIEW